MIRSNRKVACPILDRVEKKYSAPHWVFLREVRNDTGFQSTRSADALAIGMYHSRGQEIIGFEKKVHRSDWLKELREPGKAEAICQFCDHWFIVTPDPDIVKPDELPPTWGLMVVQGSKLSIKKPAPLLKAKPIDRGMLAAIIERTVENAVKPYLVTKEEQDTQAYNTAFEDGKKGWCPWHGTSAGTADQGERV